MKKMLRLVLVLLVLLLILNFSLPYVLESGTRKVLSNMVPDLSDYELSVSSAPNLAVLWGRFDEIQFKSDDLVFGGLRFESVDILVENVLVDMGMLFSEQELVFKNSGDITVHIFFTEDDLNGFMLKEHRLIKQSVLEIREGLMVIKGFLSYEGKEYELVVLGDFVVGDQGSKVSFVAHELTLDGLKLPEDLESNLLEMLELDSLAINLRDFDVPIVFEKVELVDGGLNASIRSVGGN